MSSIRRQRRLVNSNNAKCQEIYEPNEMCQLFATEITEGVLAITMIDCDVVYDE